MSDTPNSEPAAQEDVQSDGENRGNQDQFHSYSELAQFMAVAVGIALIVRMLIFQPFNIPSGSMRPTLLVGDFIYVSKTEYGYSRASLIWPLSRLPVHGRILPGAPERGDVVVFKNKKDNNRDYIKRLIGMPGDEISIRGGTIMINDVAVQRDYLGMVEANCDDSQLRAVPVYRETLPNGVSYSVQECYGDEGLYDWRGPYRVPTGHYFMMGDNRDQSEDSRVEARVGTVPFGDFVGEAQRVVISVDGNRAKFWQFWKWPSAIRSSRTLRAL